MFLAVLTLYVVVLLYIGFQQGKDLRSLEAYYLANRQLPWWWAAGSILASWFGAASTIVTFERSALQGISAFWWIGMPTLITLAVLAWLSPWIRNLPDFSIPNLMERSYGPRFARWSAFVLTLYLATLAASQAVALGRTLKGLSGWPYHTALGFGLLAVVIYTSVGGFRSVVITDLVQMSLIIVLVIFAYRYLPYTQNATPTPDHASRFDFFYQWKIHLGSTFSFVLAWTISPIAWQRIAAVRERRRVRTAIGSSMLAFAVLYGAVVLCGTLWGIFRPNSTTIFAFLNQQFARIPRSIGYLGLLAAVMSTLDTALNTGAMMLTDLLPQRFKRTSSTGLTTLGATLVIALIAGGIAAWLPKILTVLGLSSEIIAIGLCVPILATRWVRVTRPLPAWCATLTGLTIVTLSFIATGAHASLPGWLRWPQVLFPGIFLAILAYLIPSLSPSKHASITE